MTQTQFLSRNQSRAAFVAATTFSLCFLSGPAPALGQGCIAVRGGGACGTTHPMGMEPGSGYLEPGDWLASVGYRWLHSDKHFVGDIEQKQRQALGNQVVNDSHFIDLSASYQISDRFSAALTLPFAYSERSSLYEHDRVNRHSSEAGGVGDLRLTGYAWVFDPKTASKGNLSFGLGAKFPTGDYRATDTFYTAKGPVVANVDQSIQPGDGGYGFTAETFGFYEFLPRTQVYAQGFYLFNPENMNGASTATGGPRGNPFEQVMSVTDQYLGRAGVSYLVWPKAGLSFSLGGRIEGIPVWDAIGDSDGFRRPGFTMSIEPGVSFMKGKWSANVTAPVALYRNRERSVADMRWSAQDGKYHEGDAAFADFVITASISRRF
jgi:hypothetical protein